MSNHDHLVGVVSDPHDEIPNSPSITKRDSNESPLPLKRILSINRYTIVKLNG